MDERKFIERQTEAGYKPAQIALQLGISIWTVRKWQQRLKKGGLFSPSWVVLLQAP
ncbi:MAG: sigma-70 family RNA polymerase sigma factor [Lewinellaceae bacterium]|nr:sigma-70 family RNA polymerase sigma factor [Lewinellaceae bacterium]